MKLSSSSLASSPSSSSSSKAALETDPSSSSSSSSSSPPPLSLQSPQLQAEFLEFQNKARLRRVFHESPVSSPTPPASPLPSPSSSPSSSSTSPSYNKRTARLSLSSPELLSELRESRTRSLRHVSARNGLTTVFSGRGRGRETSSHAPSSRPANQKAASGRTANGDSDSIEAGRRLTKGMKR